MANNYVEIYHPTDRDVEQPAFHIVACDGAYQEYPNNSNNWYCNLRLPGATAPPCDIPRISAAILSVAHSFRVQNYAYGVDNPLGRHHVNGAIAQKYRGIVGLIGTSGLHQELQLRPAAEVPVAAPVPQPRGERVADRDLGRAEAGVRLERPLAAASLRVRKVRRMLGGDGAPG